MKQGDIIESVHTGNKFIIEYISNDGKSFVLVYQDDARVRGRIKAISANRCGRCGDKLPVADCCLKEEESCWARLGWHNMKLEV